MNRIDRALGILLLLRDGESISAADLARRFEVSTRTIYRDVESLSQVGVPVYAERGREGGFRLVPGYFLPPIMFSQSEAVSLLLAVTMLRNLRARPFAAELQLAEEKLLAAMPRKLRQTLAAARRVIGTEAAPRDSFHPEPQDAPPADGGDEPEAAARESHVVSVFLQAILDRRMLALDYHSPYRGQTDRMRVAPLGIFWDRDRWYLVGRPDDAAGKAPRRLWRADRVRDIRPLLLLVDGDPAFDVRDELGRRWLRAAMAAWARDAPVRMD
jgi:predicted DNA-binding transcriptional regulator YafY